MLSVLRALVGLAVLLQASVLRASQDPSASVARRVLEVPRPRGVWVGDDDEWALNGNRDSLKCLVLFMVKNCFAELVNVGTAADESRSARSPPCASRDRETARMEWLRYWDAVEQRHYYFHGVS